MDTTFEAFQAALGVGSSGAAAPEAAVHAGDGAEAGTDAPADAAAAAAPDADAEQPGASSMAGVPEPCQRMYLT